MGSDVVEVIKYGPATLYRIMRELGIGPSRREQRRARKAAKNLAMYKLAGRRPWNQFIRPSWRSKIDSRTLDECILPREERTEWVYRYDMECRIPFWVRPRAPSGFKYMSAIADSIGKL